MKWPAWIMRLDRISVVYRRTEWPVVTSEIPPQRWWSWTDSGWWLDASATRSSPDLTGVTRKRDRL